MDLPAATICIWGLVIAALTAGLVAFIRKIVRASAFKTITIGAVMAPVLWIGWGASFLYTGTPSSDHDESLVYLGVSILLALMSLPLTLATSYLTVRLVDRR